MPPAKKKTTARKSSASKSVKKMDNPSYLFIAAQVIASATNAVHSSSDLVVKRNVTTSLPGAREGLKSRTTFEDGTVITVQVIVN